MTSSSQLLIKSSSFHLNKTPGAKKEENAEEEENLGWSDDETEEVVESLTAKSIIPAPVEEVRAYLDSLSTEEKIKSFPLENSEKIPEKKEETKTIIETNMSSSPHKEPVEVVVLIQNSPRKIQLVEETENVEWGRLTPELEENSEKILPIKTDHVNKTQEKNSLKILPKKEEEENWDEWE